MKINSIKLKMKGKSLKYASIEFSEIEEKDLDFATGDDVKLVRLKDAKKKNEKKEPNRSNQDADDLIRDLKESLLMYMRKSNGSDMVKFEEVNGKIKETFSSRAVLKRAEEYLDKNSN